MSDGIQYFYCLANPNSASKVKEIEQELRRYGGLEAWKESNKELIELAKILNNLELASSGGDTSEITIKKGLQVFIWQTQEKTEQLRKES